MRRSTLLLPLCLVAASLLAGCGQKGPLYLPVTRPAPASTAPTVAPAPAASVMPAGASS